jgi:quercetin dioxygenase-like cupin family protein
VHRIVTRLRGPFLLSALVISTGCRSSQPCPTVQPEPSHEHATTSAPEQGQPPISLDLPEWTNEGPELEVAVLHEGEHGRLRKISAIALRRGTPLPVHAVDWQITIHVLQGGGELSVGDSPIAVEAGSILVVEPGAPHAMKPADETLVVLLVHYFEP